MSLTDEQKQLIRAEEYFRAEVRKEFEHGGDPPSVMQQVAAFFETRVGFWLLTTVLAGLAATGFTNLQRYLNSAELEQQQKAQESRDDTEMLLKLGPLLTSEKQPQVKMAIVLLDGLTVGKAVDNRIAEQVRALFAEIIHAGQQPDATPQERLAAEAVVIQVDQPRLATLQQPEQQVSATGAVPVERSVVDDALPVRIYIQVSDADTSAAKEVAASLREAGLMVPGIERVASRISPPRASIRYCEGKVAPGAPDRVLAASAARIDPAPELVVLDPRLCTKVRYNHFELWFAKQAG